MIVDVDADAGQRIAHQLGARFVAAGLSTIDGVRAMLTAARAGTRWLGRAGQQCRGVVLPVHLAANAAHWMRMLDLNLRGVMLSTQLAVDLMGPGGAIVNIASTPGPATARTARQTTRWPRRE